MNKKSFKIISINVSKKKGEKKRPVESVRMIEGLGIEGDAHAGFAHRQVSLLAIESIETMKSDTFEVGPGDCAENITTEGIELWTIPVGTRIRLGPDAEIEITQIGKECHDRCSIYERIGDCVMPRDGIFAKVSKGGLLSIGDEGIIP